MKASLENITGQVLIGNTNGMTALYPGNDDGSIRPCDFYDPRNRTWMIQLTEKADMNYKIYVDFTSSMKRADRIGNHKPLEIIKKMTTIFIDQLVRVKNVTVTVIQLENQTNMADFKKLIDHNKLADFFQRSETSQTVNPQASFNDLMQTFSESEGQKHILMSDMNFDSLQRRDIHFVDFGNEDRSSSSNNKTYINFRKRYEALESIIEVYYEIKYGIVKKHDQDKPVISEPYVDLMGAGEIVTIGYPIFYNEKLIGAAAIDTPILTHGVRNGPYIDARFFDGRFDSFLVTLNLFQDYVLAHPLKIMSEFDAFLTLAGQNTVDDLFRSHEEIKMIQNLRNGFAKDTIYNETIHNYNMMINNNLENRTIKFYWMNSEEFDGTSTDDFIVYGIGIYSDETELLSETSLSNKDQPCTPNFKTIKDFYEEDSLRRLDNKLSTDEDYLHLTPEAIRNSIFGADYESGQFEYYDGQFKSCLKKKYTEQKEDNCNELFTPRVFEETCFLTDETFKPRNFGKWVADATNYNFGQYVRAVYVASVGGLFKGFGQLPPYGYNPTNRPWFEHGIRHDGLQFSINKDFSDGPLIATLTKRIVRRKGSGIEKKFVVGLDIAIELFERLANETCSARTKDDLDLCAIYSTNGDLIYYQGYKLQDYNVEKLEHTMATTNSRVLAAERQNADIQTCFNRETKKCQILHIKLKNIDDDPTPRHGENCLKYKVSSDEGFKVVVRNQPVGIGCHTPAVADNECIDSRNLSQIPFCPKDQKQRKPEKNIYETCQVRNKSQLFFRKSNLKMSTLELAVWMLFPGEKCQHAVKILFTVI